MVAAPYAERYKLMNNVLFSKKTDEWETPKDLFDKLNNIFSFTLDPCATVNNAKCKKFYTKDQNGLLKSWKNETVFCNPPYSQIKLWVKKCYEEFKLNKVTVILLLPARTDTKYFHEFISGNALLFFIKGRLHFNNSINSAPFPSIIAVFTNKKIFTNSKYVGSYASLI